MSRYMFWGTQNTLPWLYRGFQYWKGKKHRWRPYWNQKWLPLHVLILLIWASGRIYCMILVTKYMIWGLKNTILWLSRGLEYWPYKKPRWQPFWNPKWLPCEVIFLPILAPVKVWILILASRHMFSGTRNTFSWLSRGLEYWKFQDTKGGILKSKMAAILCSIHLITVFWKVCHGSMSGFMYISKYTESTMIKLLHVLPPLRKVWVTRPNLHISQNPRWRPKWPPFWPNNVLWR